MSVYDRICDHNNGKLISKMEELFALCITGSLILKLVNIKTD